MFLGFEHANVYLQEGELIYREAMSKEFQGNILKIFQMSLQKMFR